MRHLALAVVLLAACKQKSEASKAKIPAPGGGAAVETDADGGMVEDAHAYEVKSWAFALDQYDLGIEDAGMTSAIEAVREKAGAELAINGGFFDEGGKALGLTISGGVQLSPFAKKLTGGVITIAKDRGRLFATETFEQPEGTRFAMQCRPRLVVGKQPNVRSDDGKRSERTALCLRDEGKTMEVYVVRGKEGEGGPSLFGLGKWLVARGCEDALNLDGGPSTGAAWLEDGKKKEIVPRGPIRQAIVFKKRS